MSTTSAQALHGARTDAMAAHRVLVIDDEPDLCTLYELSLAREGYEVTTAATVAQSVLALQTNDFDAVVSDMQLPDGLGLEVLKFLSVGQRRERCVVITAHGSAENAVEALKAGAFDYLTKPVDLKQFRSVVAQAVRLGAEAKQLTASDASLSPQYAHSATSASVSPAAATNFSSSTSSNVPPCAGLTDSEKGQIALSAIVGQSSVMQQLRERIAKVARSMAPILIRGESGTGKELAAKAIHACSHRSEGPFVAVNCSAIPEALLEAEFFGARKGSYTGAAADRIGFFQAAQGGTLFLDEVGDLPISMQAKLLRAIQERSIRPLGDTVEQPVNVRIVSATHRDLVAAVSQQLFRQDLFYRLNVIDIHLPALRERREDLPELVACLLSRIANESMLPIPPNHAALLAELHTLPLPGNVRELENLLHRALALSDGASLTLAISDANAMALPGDTSDHSSASSAQPLTASSPPPNSPATLPADLQSHLDEQERVIILRALKDTGFNRTAAAAKLGMNLRQIRYRMSRLGIDDQDA